MFSCALDHLLVSFAHISILNEQEKTIDHPHTHTHIDHRTLFRICQNITHIQSNRYAMWTLLVVKRMTCYNRCVSKTCTTVLLLLIERAKKERERDDFLLVKKNALIQKFLSRYFLLSRSVSLSLSLACCVCYWSCWVWTSITRCMSILDSSSAS